MTWAAVSTVVIDGVNYSWTVQSGIVVPTRIAPVRSVFVRFTSRRSARDMNDFENLEVDQPIQHIFLDPRESPRRSANLTGANLKGTTMPDGTIH